MLSIPLDCLEEMNWAIDKIRVNAKKIVYIDMYISSMCASPVHDDSEGAT